MNTDRVKTFNKETIDTLPWPNTENGTLAKKYLLPLIKQGPHHYFDNVKASMQALMVDDLVLPITINTGNNKDSYVCSPYTHYIHYGVRELQLLIASKVIRRLLQPILYALGIVLAWGNIDQVVIVNNWLLPTNLYPVMSQDQIQTVTTYLIERFPDHGIAFRSVNDLHPPTLAQQLKETGFDLVVNRIIYYTNTKSRRPFQARMFKSDLKLLKKSTYREFCDDAISLDAIPRIHELYHALNIKKYTQWNPQFNDNFIQLVLGSKWATIKVLKNQEKIDAVLAYFTFEGKMTSPFFGYDTSLPKSLGLYRQISTILLLDAKEKGMFLHQSSGGGNFKTLRRAKTAMEYIAIYHQHLPYRRRIPWKVLKFVMNVIGKRFMEKYKP